MATFAEILRGQVADLEAERAALIEETDALADTATTEARALTVDEDARIAAIIERGNTIRTEIEARQARIAELDALRLERSKAPQVLSPEPVAPSDIRSLSPVQVRDASMRIIDAASDSRLSPASKAGVQALIETSTERTDGNTIGQRLLATENDAYRGAFMKLLRYGDTAGWTPEEARAVGEYRALSIGVDTAGGFGIPVLIDPTIIITNGTTASPLIKAMRVETITNDVWRGVSAAGTAWSFDAEAAEVSDDASSFTQPTVTTHMARGFIPYSIEFGMDYPGAASELSRLLEVGYDDLLATKLSQGTGTNEPWGIFVALDANTNAEVTVTTNAQFGDVDIDKVWAALPEKWRARASWFMSVGYENKIRAFGSGTATSRFTVDQTKEGISLLNGRPVILSDYAPAVATTTTARNLLAVGDFSNYVLAQRAGMSIEVLPLVVGTTSNRPTGERGLFAYARVGADSVLDTAFRLLTNT